jgi:hypothetical protein
VDSQTVTQVPDNGNGDSHLPPAAKRRPDDRRRAHVDEAQRLLERLREVGPAGITTGELIREGRYGGHADLPTHDKITILRGQLTIIRTRAEQGFPVLVEAIARAEQLARILELGEVTA